jgi:hypothetical protein
MSARGEFFILILIGPKTKARKLMVSHAAHRRKGEAAAKLTTPDQLPFLSSSSFLSLEPSLCSVKPVISFGTTEGGVTETTTVRSAFP